MPNIISLRFQQLLKMTKISQSWCQHGVVIVQAERTTFRIDPLPNIEEVVVADLPESTTTSKQLKPSATTTNSLRLHVQGQLSKPARNTGKRRYKGHTAFFF